jgi:colicin import membrane protein
MTATSPSAFLLSATMHGVAVALALLLAYATSQREKETPKVLELVAGEGDNFMATEAPALGTPGGVKLAIPKAPEPKPAPPEPVKAEPDPLPPAPTPKAVTPVPAVDQPIPDFKKQIQRKIVVADSKARQQIARDRAAEKKRLEEEQKRMSKEEFDRANKSKTAGSAQSKSAPTKVAKIDAEGIAKGVVGGSTKNKTGGARAPPPPTPGGAGGKALVSENGTEMERYFAGLKTSIRQNFEPPPGLSDSLKVDIELRSNADGSLTNVRIAKSSGSAEFDQAVLDAIRRVKMPPRYDKKSEPVEFTFTMKEKSDG